jgi:type IV pilus assembly protein PilM
MARSKRILALDIGAASIKAAEFEYPGDGNIILHAFDYREYGREVTEDTRSVAVAGLLREMIAANGFAAREALVCISGQFALTRFVKLPPVAEEENRVRQIVEFEARQNVPFPMEEVIWDYQLIANLEAEELEVMFVVIKNEIVEQITGAVQEAGLMPVLVDVAPSACYNAARANHIGDEECAMILNLGDRSTNLLFADRQQFFTRTIPIAGHSITQQIAKEFGIGMEEAEELKRRHGFVALGGAYAEPESEVAAAVSKIVRNVMTRLHGEINRSIGVYRAQQKGNMPKRLFLTGGSSTMGYTDKFFAEKLNLPVEYFNPFQVVRLGPQLDAGRLQEVAHTFSEVIGLGLRYASQLPVEVSLMPESIVRQVALRQKRPYLAACMVTVLLILLVAVLAKMREVQVYRNVYESKAGEKAQLEKLQKQIAAAHQSAERVKEKYDTIATVLARREAWPAVLNELEALKPSDLWLFSLEPKVEFPEQYSGPPVPGRSVAPPPVAPPPMMTTPFSGSPAGPLMPGASGMAGRQVQTRIPLVVIREIEIQGHSVTLEGTAAETGDAVVPAASVATADVPTATADTAAADAGKGRAQNSEQIFLARLQESPLFDPENTEFVSYRADDRVLNLKTFTIVIRLKEPIQVNYR